MIQTCSLLLLHGFVASLCHGLKLLRLPANPAQNASHRALLKSQHTNEGRNAFGRDPPTDGRCEVRMPFDWQDHVHTPITLGGLVDAMWEDPGRLAGALLATCRKTHEDEKPLEWCYDKSKMPAAVSQWSGDCFPDVHTKYLDTLASISWTRKQKDSCKPHNGHGDGSKLVFIMTAHVDQIGNLRTVVLAVQGRLALYPACTIIVVDNYATQDYHDQMAKEFARYGKSVILSTNPDVENHPYELGGYYHGIQVLEGLKLPPDHLVFFTQSNLILVKPLPPLELLQKGCDVTPVFAGWGNGMVELNKENARPWPDLERVCPGGTASYRKMAQAFDRAGRKHVWGYHETTDLLHVAFMTKVSFAVNVLKPVLQAAPSCQAKIGEIVTGLLVVGGAPTEDSVPNCTEGFDFNHEGDGVWDSLGYYFLKVHPIDNVSPHSFWQTVAQVFFEADPRRTGQVDWEAFLHIQNGKMAKDFCRDVMSNPMFNTASWWSKGLRSMEKRCSKEPDLWECFAFNTACTACTANVPAADTCGNVSQFAESWTPMSCNKLRELAARKTFFGQSSSPW